MTTEVDSVSGGEGRTEELRRRDAALQVTAWGERFVLVQPRNPCFWIYLWLVGTGVSHLFSQYSTIIGYYGSALSISFGLAAVYALLWWWWFRHIDRWEHQPVSLAVAAFVWGGFGAALGLAANANDAMISLYTKVFGQVWASNWEAGLTAPFTEETLKGAGFLLLMGLAPRLIRTANDGLVIGAFIGLGFQILEDVSYAVNGAATDFGTDPVGGAERISALRFATGLVSHPLFSALFCAGLIYVIGTEAQPRRFVRGILFILAGMLTHGAWDSASALAGGIEWLSALLLVAIPAFGLVVLWIAFRLAARPERGWVRDVLAPEVTDGILTTGELDALVGGRRQRRRFIRAGGSLRQRRARRHVLVAAQDLLDDLVAAKGTPTPDVEAARAEVTRLRATADAY
jgi:RsiW-degrading membrane proteinase PrsW (M82 family)